MTEFMKPCQYFPPNHSYALRCHACGSLSLGITPSDGKSKERKDKRVEENKKN